MKSWGWAVPSSGRASLAGQLTSPTIQTTLVTQNQTLLFFYFFDWLVVKYCHKINQYFKSNRIHKPFFSARIITMHILILILYVLFEAGKWHRKLYCEEWYEKNDMKKMYSLSPTKKGLSLISHKNWYSSTHQQKQQTRECPSHLDYFN